MKFPFGTLPLQAARRPIVSVTFPGLPGVRVPALVDSGATANRFDVAFAQQLGLDLTQARQQTLRIAGGQYFAHVLETRLRVGRWEWQAPVGFVEGWTHPHGVLGIDGFFDRFTVRFEAASSYLVVQSRSRQGKDL